MFVLFSAAPGTNRPDIRSVYVDSSPDPLDDPKVETIVELLFRIWVGHVFSLCLEGACCSLFAVC